jgi:hypothetical protein
LSAFAIGGRARPSGDAVERARKAIYNRVRDSVARISELHPELGRHLRAAVRTGRVCSYQPERRTEWSVG